MAETQQQAEARLRGRYPQPQVASINGEDVAMTQAAYDAWIAASATAEVATQVEAEAEMARLEVRRQVRAARTRLQQIEAAGGALTNAQRDQGIKDIARIVDRVIGVLIDLRLVEREG